MWERIGRWVECLFEEHKFVRRLLVLWAVWLITLLVLKLISLMTAIDMATGAVVTSIIGILATVLAFYIRSRELDQQGAPE